MEELTIELDDETVAWLEATAAARRQSLSEFVEELIRELRKSRSADARPA
jgi:hypothetical protein